MTSTTANGNDFALKRLKDNANGLAGRILEGSAASVPFRCNGGCHCMLRRLEKTHQNAGQGRVISDQVYRGTRSSRTDSRYIVTESSQKPDQVMSKAVQAIRNFFGIPHKPKSCWDDFHAATERVAEKTKKILEDRNDFHHSVKRMKTRKRK